ncbi:MAG: DUF2066 domain-containing protein [Hyphomicrobiales bacterium]|nr:DUF2066 domain-containing protein [Hyphomicrobiales bacterium]
MVHSGRPSLSISGEPHLPRLYLARITFLAMLALVVVSLFAPCAGAQDMSGLYQATVIVTGTDMRSRPTGFARCLRDVLVKVSGEPRLIKDPRVTELGRHADVFVVDFSYVDVMAGIPIHDDQGTYDRPHYLTVKFDPAKIDQTLRDLGEKPWRGERPVVVPMLSMRRYGPPFLLSAELAAAADERGSFAERAAEFGLSARIPSEAELAGWGAEPGRIPPPPDAARAHEIVVAGTLAFNEGVPGWEGSWRMHQNGRDYVWAIKGVNYDEAFRDIIRGVLRVASGHDGPI